mgnify:CR=1 FL=1
MKTSNAGYTFGDAGADDVVRALHPGRDPYELQAEPGYRSGFWGLVRVGARTLECAACNHRRGCGDEHLVVRDVGIVLRDAAAFLGEHAARKLEHRVLVDRCHFLPRAGARELERGARIPIIPVPEETVATPVVQPVPEGAGQ